MTDNKEKMDKLIDDMFENMLNNIKPNNEDMLRFREFQRKSKEGYNTSEECEKAALKIAFLAEKYYREAEINLNENN